MTSKIRAIQISNMYYSVHERLLQKKKKTSLFRSPPVIKEAVFTWEVP